MKFLLTFLCLSLSLQFPASAQPKQKAEREFLKQLNNIVKNSKEQHWAYTGTMSIDSAFAINKEGILSVTVRYTNDSSFIVSRMEAPVSNIEYVAYDLYLILKYSTDEVNTYVSAEGSNVLQQTGKTNLFHIGAPLSDGYKKQEKLQKAANNVLQYYK